MRVDVREWKDDKPTKKGISLNLMRWKNWVDYAEYLDQGLRFKKNYKSHLGWNVYCTVTEGMACMDIRQYGKPYKEEVPTKKGLCFRPIEYAALKALYLSIFLYWPRSYLSITPGSANFEILIKKTTKNNKNQQLLAEFLFK